MAYTSGEYMAIPKWPIPVRNMAILQISYASGEYSHSQMAYASEEYSQSRAPAEKNAASWQRLFSE
jgi:hypothetical protein